MEFSRISAARCIGYLFDGSFHEVDSNEMAFKIAGSMAMKGGGGKSCATRAYDESGDVTPEENMGDVIGDLNRRRGLVQGMDDGVGGAKLVRAEVPLAEMLVHRPPWFHAGSCIL